MLEAVLFILLAIGLITLSLQEMSVLYEFLWGRWKIWLLTFRNEEGWLDSEKERFDEKVFEHLRILLQGTFSMGKRKSVKGFLIFSCVFSSAAFSFTFRVASFSLAITAACCCAILPYMALQCIMQKKRIAGSKEGEILVTELLNNYKIYYCNMRQAIEVTAMNISGAPYSKAILLNLSKGLNKASTPGEIDDLLGKFRFSLGTSWANILAINIGMDFISGIGVTESLSDLALSMGNARKIEEFSKRENNETGLMLKYLIPACWILMIAGGRHYFGLTLSQFLNYQFNTGAGMTWFVLVNLLYLLSIGAHLLLSKRKFDL